MYRYLISTILFLMGSVRLLAQPGEPFTQNFPPAAYQSDAYISSPQNWGIIQDNRGIVYVSNTTGVLEYDGISWKLVQGTGYTGRFQFAKNSEGKIFVSSNNDFGYLAPDSAGRMRFVSLWRHLKRKYPGFRAAKAAAVGRDVYFSTEQHVFRWSGRKFKVWGSKAGFAHIFSARNQLYAIDKAKGLCVLEQDRFIALPGAQGFDSLHVTALLPLPETKASKLNFFVVTFEQGLYKYENQALKKLTLGSSPSLDQEYFMHGITLADGSIALATVTKGIVMVNRKGKVKKVIDKQSGLSDNTVLHLYKDREGGLWAGLNKGISRIDYPSPITYLNETSGLDGIVLSILKKGKRLYAGTSSGLYITDEDTPELRFQKFPQLQTEVWKIVDLGDTLLIVSTPGVYVLASQVLKKVSPPRDDIIHKNIHQSKSNPYKFYVGSSDGLSVLTRVRGRWKWEGNIKGVGHDVIWLAEDKNGMLWASCDDNISAIDASREYGLQPPVRNYKPSAELAKKLHRFEAKSINGHIYFGTSEGIYSIKQKGKRLLLQPDSTFGALFANNSREAINLTEDQHGRIWLTSEFKTGPLEQSQDNAYAWDTIPLSRIPRVDVWTIHPDPEGVVWLGTTEGIYRYNPAVPKSYKTRQHTVLRKVKLSGDSTIFHGAFPQKGTASIEQTASFQLTLPHAIRSIRFEYAATSYDAPAQLMYSYMLEGEDKTWSHWTTETNKEFTGLDEGNYVFKVKSRNIYGTESLASTFEFSSLPPLYRTWWAYTFYGLCILLGLVALDRFQRRRLILREREKSRERELAQAREIERAYHELKQTQNQLVQKEKMASLGELTAGIAHEIQNPLNFVNNFSELGYELVEELRDGPLLQLPKEAKGEAEEILKSLDQNLQKIHHHGRRADAIVKNMLQHSRASSGETQLTNLNDLADEYLRLAYHGLRAKDKSFDCTLETSFDAKLEKVELVQQDMGQVLLNLYNNAFYAVKQKQQTNPEGYLPKVSVSTRRQGRRVEIRVRDNGVGIPENVKSKIFQPFFTTKPAGQGTGLGLSLSYDMITKGHKGGELNVATEEGEWTEFIISLPYVPVARERTAASTAPPPPANTFL
jgi:signal transduction histidine kinase/ligand-binding sensor domain-containing protein